MKYSPNTTRHIRGCCVDCVRCVQGINPDQIEHFWMKHECNFCNKTFDDTELKLKHEINKHKCNFCDELFMGTSMDDKVKHLGEVHGGE